MDEERFPTVWSLTCPRCHEVVTVEMPVYGEDVPGIGRCSAGHDLLTFEADTVGTLALGRTP
jgi:hypothetical protein